MPEHMTPVIYQNVEKHATIEWRYHTYKRRSISK